MDPRSNPGQRPMKWLLTVLGMSLSVYGWTMDQRVYLLSKRQIVNSNHTLVVMFHDEAITTIEECQREIQRGYRGQWRFYRHSFPRPSGYAENKDYLCIEAPIQVEPWNEGARYDWMYLIDIRSSNPVIKKVVNLAECLNELRNATGDESRKFFCGKLSQMVRL